MSKSNIRKITADPTKCNIDSSRRPSVFERLGTKPAIATTTAAQNTSDYCRNWALNGSCSYGKNCKYANTHTLISPSKRAKKDNAIANASSHIEDPFKRLTSKIVKKASHSPDLNIEEWNQTDLEYEDEKALERRRQLLQRELELQMKKDKEVHGKDKVRQKKKAMSSSSSSHTSSTSSSSSSSSSEDSSSTSTSDSRKKIKKIKTKRHHNASIDYNEDKEKKRKLKLKRLGTKNDKAVGKKKRKLDGSSTKKDLTARSVKKHGSSSRKHSNSLHGRSPTGSQQGSSSGVTSTSGIVIGSSVSVAHHASSSKIRERNRSESPKSLKPNREMDKEESRHYKKMRDADECLSKDTVKCKSLDKIKEQQDKEKTRAIDEKVKSDDRQRSKCKDKDVHSRTPPLPSSSERSSKHQHVKENASSKTRRSRTPDKAPSRTRRDLTPIKNPEKQSNLPNRARDAEKKERDSHKRDKSKEREDVRKSEQNSSNKTKQTALPSQDESYRRSKEHNFDEKTYSSEKPRQKSRERQREKETREERYSRLPRDQRQELQRDKDKDESQERCRNERQRERERDRDRDRDRERERDRDRDRDRDRERDREREREREMRERDRDRDREREKPMKSRERDVSAVVSSSSTLNLSVDKNSRYSGRTKERSLTKDAFEKSGGTRERGRSDRERERSETKALVERNSTQSRLEGRYERSGVVEKDASSSRSKSSVNSPRDRMDRFRETSLDRASLHDKGGHAVTSSSAQSTAPLSTIPSTSSSSSATIATPVLSSSRDLIDMVDGHYDRDRHRRFGVRYERGHTSEHTTRKDQVRIESSRVPNKIDRIVDRRDATSPRRAIEVDRNFGRNYGRMPEHWDEQEESSSHVEYRDHAHIHEEDRRKTIEGRRYDSPFEERRVAREERPRESRYVIQATERTSFDDHRHHHHHHRHPVYPSEKLRTSGTSTREENISNDDWEGHHRDVEHSRDRGYSAVEWEEREWRTTRALWEGRDSLPRSETHDDEWNSRYDSSMADWKPSDVRKWDSQKVHVRSHYRKERSKEIGESAQHSKRRSYNVPETREEPVIHPSAKQAAIYGSMKEEPINKKLMELAEGRLCTTTTREKSTDSFQKKTSQKEKPEIKESVAMEPKRPVTDESLQTLHTESDLSDISDDPDDILNMEEDITDIESSTARANKKVPEVASRDVQPTTQESTQGSPKESTEEAIFSSKSKDNVDTVSLKNMEDDNMETMDFEEISDGELEEDIKTSGKGLGDALGVDWESLVKETQARRTVSSSQDSTENRWQCKAIFYRIGISKKYAGEDFVNKLLTKYEKNDNNKLLLDDVALVHTALARDRMLQDLGNGIMHAVDDSLYRNNNADYDEDIDYDWETLKPSVALQEEIKCLLQQVV